MGAEQSEYESPEWILSKSLLEVNDACTETLQELLLQTTRPEGDVSADALQRQMDDLIERHERLIAELELAREMVGELE